MIIIKSNSNDPSYNLALEEYIFEYMPQDEDYFWLWQNQDAVIIGKHQNTAQEINKAYTENNNIKVVRRLSGGGAVFHDRGNVNFTFITNVGDLQKINIKMFCMPVIETLKGIGVEAELNGCNDMTIDGKKFSGNAQYIKKGSHYASRLYNV